MWVFFPRMTIQLAQALPCPHRPVSRRQVLQRSGRRLQSVVVVAAGEQRQVEPHHLRLVQQLQSCRRQSRGRAASDEKQRKDERKVFLNNDPPEACYRLSVEGVYFYRGGPQPQLRTS